MTAPDRLCAGCWGSRTPCRLAPVCTLQTGFSGLDAWGQGRPRTSSVYARLPKQVRLLSGPWLCRRLSEAQIPGSHEESGFLASRLTKASIGQRLCGHSTAVLFRGIPRGGEG